MTELLVIGAGKFALEVTRYVEDLGDGYRIAAYLAVDGDVVEALRAKATALEEFEPAAGASVVLGISDAAQRRAVIRDFVERHDLTPINVVHPEASIARACLRGTGNIVGPRCYVGVNVDIGSFNVLNYHCTVGHHSRIGSNNFFSPNFNCGNSVLIGDDNLFGVSCTLAPEVKVGDACRFQAGLTIFDGARSGHSYVAPNRVKAIQSV